VLGRVVIHAWQSSPYRGGTEEEGRWDQKSSGWRGRFAIHRGPGDGDAVTMIRRV
jgi:hypothetical protein